MTEDNKLKAVFKIKVAPSKTSQLENDSGFITKDDIEGGIDVDLSDYATKEDLNNAVKNVSHLTGIETLTDKTLENSTIKDELVVTGNEQEGERFSVSFINGTAQLATNNGLDILPITNFVTSPTIEADDELDKLLPNNVITKKQAQTLTSDFVTGDEVDKKIDDALVNIGSGGEISLDGYLSKEDASQTYSTKENVTTSISAHNTNTESHADIRGALSLKANISDVYSKTEIDTKLANKADSETIDDVFDELTALQTNKLNKNFGSSNSGKWLKIDSTGNAIPDTLPSIGGGDVSDKYGIQADYAIHYGILDCPRGLIDYSVNTKEIEIQSGIVIQAAGADTRTTIASPITYEVEQTGDIVLFFTRTESESGTIQTGFLEAGNVYYQEEEPTNGTTSYLAWWKPSKGLWQFKSDQTGNVWREAVATPIANIRAGLIGITSINYIGYRIIDDDIIAQQSEIDSLHEIIETLTNRLNILETKSFVVSDDVSNIVQLTQTEYDALEDKDAETMYCIVG